MELLFLKVVWAFGRVRQKDWLAQLKQRRSDNVVAMAAKQARMVWAVMAGRMAAYKTKTS
jgi:hypothetical protein